jgi:hypothetical protein
MTCRPLAVRAAAALLALCGVLACTDGGSPVASPSPSVAAPTSAPASATATASPTGSPSATPPSLPSPSPASPPAPACPGSYAAPDPGRPVVALSFVVPEDKRVVRGTERVTFTPDLPVRRLVFRLWANGPSARRGGGSLVVTRAVVDGRQRSFTTESSGTLVSIPLGRRVAPGTTVVADLTFTLTLPSGVNERWGRSGSVAWFGSGFPLLAWERGRGWAVEPPTSAFAEAASSEAFRLTLRVTAPAGDTVLATGRVAGGSGRVERRTAASVRDVLVAVGPFRVTRGRAGGTPVAVGVAPGLPDDAGALLAKHQQGVAALAARFGPFPYESLDVAVVPVVRGGIEFPAGIILGSGQDRDATLVHEIAHEWFYGLVGDNQGRDPWLDEAFATYAEALVRGTGGRYLSQSVPPAGRNRVGAPMTYWEPRTDDYYRSVYVQGAAMLLRARSAVGAAAFDRGLRCYVNANAHRIATPADVREAFAGLPAVVATLREKGALPPR